MCMPFRGIFRFISCVLHSTCKAQSRTWCACYGRTSSTTTALYALVCGDTALSINRAHRAAHRLMRRLWMHEPII
ncbi:hypothetical protein BJY52DRAFT_1327068 [Lactarius psammicola]|nr:hypothetical protein BJY52DRAFT_1327068 [Lactarius psammicola]